MHLWQDAPGAGANRRGDGEYDSIKAEEANHELSDWEGEGRGSVATRLGHELAAAAR